MTATPQDAARFAHAALTGLLLVEGFDPDDFTRDAVLEVETAGRATFLVHALWAALFSHAGTLRALADRGADVPMMLADFGAAHAAAAQRLDDQ